MLELFPPRLQHRHYYINALLSTPAFILVLANLYRSGLRCQDQGLLISAVTGLAMPFGLTRLFERSELIERRRSKLTTHLKLVNLYTMFLLSRNHSEFIVLGTRGSSWLEVRGRYLVYWYLIGWIISGFCFPQPPYLGPSKVVPLSSNEFDEKVLFIAPASATSDELETIGEVDLSLLPSVAMMDKYKELKKSSRLYRVVLFHAEWSMKSRELEMILSGMSCSFSSPTLEFNILTTESCPTTFYDLELSIYPSSLDLPVLYLYHQGELIGRLPGEGEFKELKVEDEGIDSVDEGEESEDERDVERRKGMERMRWDRSSKSIIAAFDLHNKSAKKSA